MVLKDRVPRYLLVDFLGHRRGRKILASGRQPSKDSPLAGSCLSRNSQAQSAHREAPF